MGNGKSAEKVEFSGTLGVLRQRASSLDGVVVKAAACANRHGLPDEWHAILTSGRREPLAIRSLAHVLYVDVPYVDVPLPPAAETATTLWFEEMRIHALMHNLAGGYATFRALYTERMEQALQLTALPSPEHKQLRQTLAYLLVAAMWTDAQTTEYTAWFGFCRTGERKQRLAFCMRESKPTAASYFTVLGLRDVDHLNFETSTALVGSADDDGDTERSTCPPNLSHKDCPPSPPTSTSASQI